MQACCCLEWEALMWLACVCKNVRSPLFREAKPTFSYCLDPQSSGSERRFLFGKSAWCVHRLADQERVSFWNAARLDRSIRSYRSRSQTCTLESMTNPNAIDTRMTEP